MNSDTNQHSAAAAAKKPGRAPAAQAPITRPALRADHRPGVAAGYA